MSVDTLRKWIEAAGRAGVLRKARGREYHYGDFSVSSLRRIKEMGRVAVAPAARPKA